MTAATVLTTSGRALPLPGLATHPLLEARSAVLAEAVAHLGGIPEYATFLAPYDRPPARAGHVRITLLGCESLPPRHLRAVVAVSPPGDLCGLTGTELEILGALVGGATAESIAAAWGIPAQIVEGHLERVRIKLAVRHRIMVGLRAFREGLYVPTGLAAVTRS
jgi:DNA-binding CsgD family transcriptional regulator